MRHNSGWELTWLIQMWNTKVSGKLSHKICVFFSKDNRKEKNEIFTQNCLLKKRTLFSFGFCSHWNDLIFFRFTLIKYFVRVHLCFLIQLFCVHRNKVLATLQTVWRNITKANSWNSNQNETALRIPFHS